MGCSGFRTCKGQANRPEWGGQTTRARRRNWLSFYCDAPSDTGKVPSGLVANCVGPSRQAAQLAARSAAIADERTAASEPPRFKCFTSWDSNWSLNAVMVHRRAALEQVGRVAW